MLYLLFIFSKLLILIFILLLIKLEFNKKKKSDKWIVMTAFKPPFPYLINLLNILDDWKMVVISNNNNIDEKWKELNYLYNLVYITLKEQMDLGYHITNYLSFNSYARKNIGYLYAIQHGAKEIFEIDEDIIVSDLNSSDLNSINHKMYFGIRNDSRMINPYIHFGEMNIWPRGFRLSDISYQNCNKFYFLDRKQLLLKPLIYQGLINGVPDSDSILQKTKNFKIETNFSSIDPLIYFPGYFIPINSKSTKYLYELFPFLCLTSSISEKISDIFRGYILQYFAWRYNGCVVYHSSKNYKARDNITKKSNFIEEKILFYNLDKYLNILNNTNLNLKLNAIDTLFSIINNLIEFGFLGEKDLNIYKAYIEDLSNIGYIFSSKFINKVNYDYKEYIISNTQFNSFIPYKTNDFLKINHKKIKIYYHKNSLIKYKNILLIINYNINGFEYLNNYILNLYQNIFPNIVFIMPNETSKSQNTVFCQESFNGYFSYICLEKVFLKYPNYKGYLFANDDDFMKTLEFDNFNFNIPWSNQFNNLKSKRSLNWFHFDNCLQIHNILNNNAEWKENLTKFLGYYDIPISNADFYYLPNFIVPKFCKILREMYNSKIFLECAVASAMGIMLYKEYQLIYFKGLWEDERNNPIDYLYKKYNQIVIHQIKFSNIKYQNKINLYNYFMKAEDF
jgi:hypothetical protein